MYNRLSSISQAVRSVQAQSWNSVEHVVIDGASTDGTVHVLQLCVNEQTVWVSEPDKGIYDALNKGMARATGDVIGLMNSDDFLLINMYWRVLPQPLPTGAWMPFMATWITWPRMTRRTSFAVGVQVITSQPNWLTSAA